MILMAALGWAAANVAARAMPAIGGLGLVVWSSLLLASSPRGALPGLRGSGSDRHRFFKPGPRHRRRPRLPRDNLHASGLRALERTDHATWRGESRPLLAHGSGLRRRLGHDRPGRASRRPRRGGSRARARRSGRARVRRAAPRVRCAKAEDLVTADDLFEPEYLVRLANARMPFGKYAGSLLVDLPEAYIVWFARKGYPGARSASCSRRSM